MKNSFPSEALRTNDTKGKWPFAFLDKLMSLAPEISDPVVLRPSLKPRES